MERKIGEIFEYKGEWYQCVEGNGCENCAFKARKCYLEDISDDPIGECCYDRRRDNKSVIFKKLEKVGVPKMFNGRMVKKLRKNEADGCTGCCFWDGVNCTIIDDCHSKEIYVEIKQNKEDMEEKNEVKDANVLSKEEWCIIKKAQEDWKRIFPDIPLMSSMSVSAFFPHIIELGLLDKYKEHSNSEKIGKDLKPFDLEAAKAGKPVCTRDGRKARIICFDAKAKNYGELINKMVVLVEDIRNVGNEIIMPYNLDGTSYASVWKNDRDNDLMMLSEKKEGWINVYKNDEGKISVSNTPYKTREEAFNYRTKYQYIDTVKITWEE